MKELFILYSLSAVLAAVPLSADAAQPITVDQELLLNLQETITQQQRQLQHQSEQIRVQSESLQKLQQQITAIQKQQAGKTCDLPAVTTVPDNIVKVDAPYSIKSGNKAVTLTLSGQINRAVNVINDGGRTKLYHVDNDASNTSLRFSGAARINNDLALKTILDLALTADESSQVSQDKQMPGNYFDTNKAEIVIESKKLGSLSLGMGSTASSNTANVDLSRTDIVLYSSIADIAGGIKFRNKNGVLNSDTIADTFNNFDGLGHKSRLRYDSPTLMGFTLSGSLVSGQRSDLGLIWGGEGYGFQAAAGFGLANPKLEASGLQYDSSFSILHTATGLNLTVAGGIREMNSRNDATNIYTKLGWLADLTSLGKTAFGVDYTGAENLAAPGDKGYSVGGAVVQAFEKYATELYLQYRLFGLDRETGVAVSTINMMTLGARVKF